MKKEADRDILTDNILDELKESLKAELREELKEELKSELKKELVKSLSATMKKEIKAKLEGTIRPDLMIFKNELLSLKEKFDLLKEETEALKTSSNDDDDILELELVDDSEELELLDATEELELEVVETKKELNDLFMDYVQTIQAEADIDTDKLKEEIYAKLTSDFSKSFASSISKETDIKIAAAEEKFKSDLDSEIDRVEAEFEEKLGAQEKVVEEKLRAQEKAVEEKFSAQERDIEEKLGAQEKAVEEKLSAQEKAVEEKFSAQERDIEEKLGAQEKAVEEKLGAQERDIEEKLGAQERDIEEKLGVQEKALTEKLSQEIEKFQPEIDLDKIKSNVINELELDKVRIANQQDEDNNILQDAIFDIKTQVNELKLKLTDNISDLQFVIDTKPEMDDVLQLVNNVLDDRVKTEVKEAVTVAVSDAVEEQMAEIALNQPIPVVEADSENKEIETETIEDAVIENETVVNEAVVTETVSDKAPEIKEGDIVVYRQNPRKEFNNFGIWIVKGVSITGNKYSDAIDVYPFDQKSTVSAKTVRLDEFKRLFEKIEFTNYLSATEKQEEAKKLAEEQKRQQEEIRRREAAHEKNPVGRMITGLR